MDPRPREVQQAARDFAAGRITRKQRDRIFSKAAAGTLRELGMRTAGTVERRIVRVTPEQS